MPSIDELFEAALRMHRGGDLPGAQARYEEVLKQVPRHAGALNQLGLMARQSGQFAEAVDYLLKATAIDDTQAAGFANLGEAYRGLGRFAEGIECYRRAVRLAPRSVDLFNFLGTLLEQAGRTAEAIATLQKAIELQPANPLAHYNLGNVRRKLGQHAAAVKSYLAALAAAPNEADIYLNLGVTQKELGQLVEARHSFEQVLRIKPTVAQAWLNLGGVANAEGNEAEAIRCSERALEINPGLIEAYSNLGSLLVAQELAQVAIQRLEQALAIDPGYFPALVNLGGAQLALGHTSQALAAFDRAQQVQPNDALAIKSALALPVILESQAQIDAVRRRLDESLTRLEQTRLAVRDPVNEVGVPAFYLAYLGHDEREFQARIAKMLHRAAPSLEFVAPHCGGERSPRDRGRRIRIGFASNHLHMHTIGKLNAGLIQKLDRERFEVVVFRGPGSGDEVTQAIDRSVHAAVRLSGQLARAQQQIAERELDVLVYPDIGMDALTYYLAHARLAPVQCVTWGHPLTTGIETVDYFLSSADLEVEGSEAHYTEKLVRLPHLTNYYFRPAPPKAGWTREDFGLDPQAHLYVCPQSLFKLHPENDLVFRGILAGDPQAKIVLLEPKQAAWRELLSKRLRGSLGDLADRVTWVPRQPLSDFRRLLTTANVLIDPLHFGGGDTSYEGFAVGTPIVTLPGPFLRSRITYALYRTMGLDDGVAADVDDYVARAVRLGTDRAWNEQVRQRILAENHKLYENEAAVRELEAFLLSVAT